MSIYEWAWVGFFLYFALVEGIAIKKAAEGGTLSEFLWRLFAIREMPVDRRRFVHLRRLIMLATLALLFVHFTGGGAYFGGW
jgi:hypothetical protein